MSLSKLRQRIGKGPDRIDLTAKQAGQILVIFALMLTVLIGLVGIAIDVTYAWRNGLQIQRAADAAAMAGVVYLPGAVTTGENKAIAIAGANGYPPSTVTAAPTSFDTRKMDVTITADVPTFFVNLFGVNHWTISRSARAAYNMPVPMGSPQPYYGVAGTYKIGTTSYTMKGPANEAISQPNGFWATMMTQGAGASGGDAFLPKKLNSGTNPPTGVNPTHDTARYYDYGIQMPAGSTGTVWIFDPVFCATDGRQGTGEWWLGGTNAVSSWFNLFDTHNQPYVASAQTPVGSSGTFFTNEQYTDTDEGGTAVGSPTTNPPFQCKATTTSDPNDPRFWHNKWWNLSAYITAHGGTGTISGGIDGELYKLGTTTDPGDATQDSTNGFNDFSIYVESTGSAQSAQVYGMGAMESFFLLPQSAASEFYLAQIDQSSGAGKTIEIDLWDVGDVYGLDSAKLQVLQPTSSGWAPVPSMSWAATKPSGSASTAPCPSSSGSSISVFNSSTKQYDGCWLTIDINIDPSYTIYPLTTNGWWKIRYTTGSGTDAASDLTTWQVNIRGNPVHLVL